MPRGKQQPLKARFWIHVNKRGPHAVDHDGNDIGRCYVWTGYTNPSGYGMIGLDENNSSGKRKSALAHRARWFLRHKTWPVGHLDHLCSNTSCVRLTHLEDVTQRENNRRSPKAKQDVCKHGHAMTLDNVYINKRKNAAGELIDSRCCRTCQLERTRAGRIRKNQLTFRNVSDRVCDRCKGPIQPWQKKFCSKSCLS